MPTKLSVTISTELRHALEEAREDSVDKRSIYRKHTLSSEVEELLRIGLGARASGNYITLKIDDGLWAWLSAYVAGIGLAGSMEDTIIYFMRQQLLDVHKSKEFMRLMAPHLPQSIQKALGLVL